MEECYFFEYFDVLEVTYLKFKHKEKLHFKVATVSSKGVVKGIKPGTVTITATKNGKKLTCKVKVKWQPEVETITKKTYKIDEDFQLDIVMNECGRVQY